MDRLKESQFAKLLHEYVDTYVKYKVADNDEKIMHWFLLSDESKELFLYFGKLQNDNDTLQARIAELEAENIRLGIEYQRMRLALGDIAINSKRALNESPTDHLTARLRQERQDDKWIPEVTE